VTWRRRNLGAGAALSVLVQGGPLVAAAVLSVVLARTIGPSGNGRFALLFTLCGFTSLVASLGFTAGIAYEVSRRRWSVSRAFRTSYLAAGLLGAVGIAGGLAVFTLTHGTVFEGISTWLALIALSSLPASYAYTHAEWILLGRERYEGYAGVEVLRSLTFLLIGAGLAIPFGLTGAVIGLPASALAAAAAGAYLLVREGRADTVVDSGGSLSRAVRFGLQSWGSNLLQQINYRLDVLILGGFAAAGTVGVYSVAVTVTSIAGILPQALGTVLFPRVASLDESVQAGDVTAHESDAAVAKSVRHGVLLSLPTGLVISLLLLVAVPLIYGSRFDDTTALGFILLPGVLILGIAKVLLPSIEGRGYPRYVLYVGAITVPLTVALYLILIPSFHAWGAAVASEISYCATFALMFVFFRRVTKIGALTAFVPRAEDVSDYADLARLARGSVRALTTRR
jgi:O-antigen/teichoic acid export membrane protein